MLRIRIAEEVHTATSAALGRVMNGDLGEGLPPLDWALYDTTDPVPTVAGLASGGAYSISAATDAVRRWAEHLDLAHDPAPIVPGTELWAGEVSGQPIQVWCVTDYDAFDAINTGGSGYR